MVFLNQITSPGRIRGSLEPFLILVIFDRVIQILNYSSASGTLGVAIEILKLRNFLKHQSNALVHKIIDFYYFLIGCYFKVSGNGLKFGKMSKQKKNNS